MIPPRFEPAHHVVGLVLKSHESQHLGNARVSTRHRVERRRKLQVLPGRYFIVKRGLLGQHSDAGAEARSSGSQVFTQNSHRAAGRPNQAADRVDQRRLAGTVGPNDPGHLAGFHAEGKSVDSAHTTKAALQVGDFYRVVRSCFRSVILPGSCCQ